MLLALGIGLSGCFRGRPFARPRATAEPISGDCVIIESVDGEAAYRTRDAALLVPLLEQLPSAGRLKERETLRIWVLANDVLVYEACAYERGRYLDWDEEVPEDLLAAIEGVMTDENRVCAYRFLASGAKQRDERMAALRDGRSAQFFAPYKEQSWDSYYHSLRLYYSCYEDTRMGTRRLDSVFDDTVDWLMRHDLVYEVKEPRLSAAYARENYFSRSVELLLYDEPAPALLDKVEAILQDSTREAPYARPDGRPSGVVSYRAASPYLIYMITDEPLDEDAITGLETAGDITYTPPSGGF